MSNTSERLKQMAEAIEQMKALQKQVVTSESKEERANARYKAICEIQAYLKDIAEATASVGYWSVKVPVNIYWLNQDGDPRKNHFECIFDKGTVTITESSFASSLKWHNFCNIPREEIFGRGSDTTAFADRSWLYLLNKWSAIKGHLDKATEAEMLKIMKDIQTSVNDFKSSYEAAHNFSING